MSGNVGATSVGGRFHLVILTTMAFPALPTALRRHSNTVQPTYRLPAEARPLVRRGCARLSLQCAEERCRLFERHSLVAERDVARRDVRTVRAHLSVVVRLHHAA